MWGWSFVALAAAFAWQSARVGPRKALGQVIFLSLLVPTWAFLGYQSGVNFQVGGAQIIIRVAIGFVGLLTCAARPRTMLSWRLTAVDIALAALVAVHLLGDWNAEGFSLITPVRAFGEWVLPYLIGRATIRSYDDIRELLPTALFVLIALAVVAGFEALVRVNPFELVYGPRPKEYIPLDAARWGIKRAYGPAKHAIFLGMMQLLLSPWALYAASRAWRRSGPSWWFWLPILSVVGIGFTGSRGPAIGVALSYVVACSLMFPRARIWILGALGCMAVVAALQFGAVLQALQIWSGESRRPPPRIVVGGEKIAINSTQSRLALFEIYGEAMRRAGMLGFGTTAVTGFPVNVPVGPEAKAAIKHVRFIDNIYILMLLRFGYLGLAAFVAFFAATIVDWWRRALSRGGSVAFCAGAAGAILGTMVVMLTVWMPQDFGFMLMWFAGAGSGLRAGGEASRMTIAIQPDES